MAQQLAAPTKSLLASELRVAPTNAVVYRILSRLSRSSLLSLALDWTEEGNATVTRPFIQSAGDGNDGDNFLDDFYPPANSLKELQDIYHELQGRKGSKREVIDRMLQGDWRHGLSLYQLAMADFQYLSDHPTSQKWMAHQVMPLKALSSSSLDLELPQSDAESLAVPRVHPSTFLENLQRQVMPDAKAHFQFDQRRQGAFVLLRVFVVDSPYSTELALSRKKDESVSDFDSSRTLYVAFPDGAPFVYISKAQTVGPVVATDNKSLRQLVFAGMRRALSKPQERYVIVPSNLTSRNLSALLHIRGAGRSNAAGGGWSVYTDSQSSDTPLDTHLRGPQQLDDAAQNPRSRDGTTGVAKRQRYQLPAEGRKSKRAKLVAEARFGTSCMVKDEKGIERVDVKLTDRFSVFEDVHTQASSIRGRNAILRGGVGPRGEVNNPAVSHDAMCMPTVRLTFQGVHVFAGMRQLVERGVIDGERIPGWLTGEENISVGTVRDGRITEPKGNEF